MKIWKKIAILFLMLGCVLAASSYLYNFPIPFWATAPKSQDVLYEAGSKPDNIVLTPAEDMSTMISITWRTSSSILDGVVEFARVDAEMPHYERQEARRTTLYSRELKSGNAVNCFSTILTGLAPGAAYRYRVGNAERNAWSDYHTFTTSPGERLAPFSFVYFGDTQLYPERFGQMLEFVEKQHPEVAFYMIGGDLVDCGERRNMWDRFLVHSEKVFADKPFVPAMGNHDFTGHGIGEKIFASYFTLPATTEQEASSPLNYSFQYNSVYFIVVNARLRDLGKQTRWLEEELSKAKESGFAFKVLMIHYPVYNPKSGRQNSVAKEQWVPLLDKYGVDLVLSGHDHSYMRSKPLRAGREAAQGEPGTTYVVATGCEKFYKFNQLNIAERQFTDTATYQLISIMPDASGKLALFYSARAPGGEVLDEFHLQKRIPCHYADGR